MSKHTPGPWTVDIRTETPCCHTHIYALHANLWIADMCGPHFSDEQQANARLIAAAPELLAACKEALSYADSVEFASLKLKGTRQLIASLKAAIAKAGGK